MIRSQRHVTLGLDRTLRLSAVDHNGTTWLELTVEGDTLAFGEPNFGTLRLPMGKLRDVARCLNSITAELGVRP